MVLLIENAKAIGSLRSSTVNASGNFLATVNKDFSVTIYERSKACPSWSVALGQDESPAIPLNLKAGAYWILSTLKQDFTKN
jgi:hypothetical protein